MGQIALTLVHEFHLAIRLRIFLRVLHLCDSLAISERHEYIFTYLTVLYVYRHVSRCYFPRRFRGLPVLYWRTMGIRLLHSQDSTKVSRVRSSDERPQV